MVTRLEGEVLKACREAELRQQERLSPLASAIGVPEDEVFYTWAFRKCRQHGELPNTPWAFFFHGLECDLKNVEDGRVLRLDFGPRGRVDTVTARGVWQFAMNASAPWGEFLGLKKHFAGHDIPDQDELSAGFYQFCDVWDRLGRQGCFDSADAELVAFLARCTAVGPNGMQHVTFPPGTPDRTQIDCLVAGRQVLSAQARHLLDTHQHGPPGPLAVP